MIAQHYRRVAKNYPVHIKDPKESDFGVVRGRNRRMKTWEKEKKLFCWMYLYHSSLCWFVLCPPKWQTSYMSSGLHFLFVWHQKIEFIYRFCWCIFKL